jgi:hypothetical protein
LDILSNENRQLFGEQVNDHIEKLNDLLGMRSGERFDPTKARKAGLATRLLEGSTRMLGLARWSHTLELLQRLLECAAAEGWCWDDSLSQIVSEVLETEEQVVAEILSGDIETIDNKEKFQGLQKEIEAILESEIPVSSPAVKSVPDPVFIEANPQMQRRNHGYSTLDKLIALLGGVRDRLDAYAENPDRATGMEHELETAIGESEFLIGIVGDILRRLGDSDRQFRSKVTSQVVFNGVEDFFTLHSRLRDWDAVLESSYDEFSLERETASALAVVLESFLFDIGRMYEDKTGLSLIIKMELSNEGSYLRARISDNGPDFLCDSKVDCDDAIAYYQGLLNVRSLLDARGGLLWVEPERGKVARFQFTMPCSSVQTDYVIIAVKGRDLAVPCHCIESIRKIDGEGIESDANGRFAMVSGMRVPVYGFEEIAAEEIDTGGKNDHLIAIGLAEKRVGLLINDQGRRVGGIKDQLTEGRWASITKQFFHLGEEEYPVVDVRLVLDKISYLQGLNGLQEGHCSFSDDDAVGEEIEETTVPRV